MKPNQKDELEKKTDNEFVRKFAEEKYKYGFTTEVHTDIIERGLNEDVIRLISSKKDEPEWLLEFRLKAYRHWLTLEMPTWAHLRIPEIDYQAISYYADPTKKKEGPKSMEEVDPELIKTFNKLGIPLEEQMALSGMAVDAVMDSVSVKTTFKETLMEKGIIFCSFSEAVREHPDLVKKYMGSVVGYRDNFFAALNSAVFSDGSFVYIPKGVRCPMELSTYFRINARNTGQFERTLIVADDDSYVSYLEGCTAPMRDENQLHAAIVEIIVHDRAEVKYSTVQNWYPGDAEGKGGVYNFVTKRGNCKGVDSKLSWTQVETGSAITWKYPSCILTGDNSTAEFYSVAVTNNYQQADTGTKMVLPPQSSGINSYSASSCFTFSILAFGLSILLTATMISMPAAFAWLIASTVCGMTPSSAATTKIAISVEFAPRIRIAVNASCPGVSKKVIFSPLISTI
mgnify:CR=1 FL=1